MRPTWDETWLEVAGVVAKRSLCDRAKVGAVITNKHNQLLATGYNGPPPGFPHNEDSCREWCPRANSEDRCPDLSDCVAQHAEANALAFTDARSRAGGTLYLMGHGRICRLCAERVSRSGLATVVFRPDRFRDYHDPNSTYDIMRLKGMSVKILPLRSDPDKRNDNGH